MKANYSLPGNPNVFLDRKAAGEYLVDACLNNEETEWAAASVRIKSKSDALKDIREVAGIVAVQANDEMLYEVYDTISSNLI